MIEPLAWDPARGSIVTTTYSGGSAGAAGAAVPVGAGSVVGVDAVSAGSSSAGGVSGASTGGAAVVGSAGACGSVSGRSTSGTTVRGTAAAGSPVGASTECPAARAVRVVRISDADPDVLRRLAEGGVVPDAELVVGPPAAGDGGAPLLVEVAGADARGVEALDDP